MNMAATRSRPSPFPRAQRLNDIVGFGIDQVAAAADHPPNNRPVLRLENLDTDLPLPPEAVEVTRAALDDPASNSWLPFTGDHDLRAAIADHVHARTGHRFDPEREIVITCGGTEAVLDILLATIDPGDEVVLTDPIYAGLVNRVRLAGGTPVLVGLRVQDGEWRLDRDALAAAVGPRTKALLTMSPSMPAGHVLDRSDWELIRELCLRHDLFLIHDAAMEALLFDGRELIHPLQLDGMAERTVIAGSMSKEHRMIGWRVGWIAGPAPVVSDAGWVHVYNTTTPVAVARRAATAVLRGPQGHVAQCTAELQRRRDTTLEALPGVPIVRPAGGWSLLIDTKAMGVEPADASRALLAQGVAATPMTGWGAEVAARHIRFVFSAEPTERLRELGDRLTAAGLTTK
jgi:N-succinyldiaminopimelate aminotransferase